MRFVPPIIAFRSRVSVSPSEVFPMCCSNSPSSTHPSEVIDKRGA
jgi:hypothetical protein